MSFKKSKRPAYRSRRSPKLAPCFPQATLVEGGEEDLHRVDSVHFTTASNWPQSKRRRSPGTRQWGEGTIDSDRGICIDGCSSKGSSRKSRDQDPGYRSEHSEATATGIAGHAPPCLQIGGTTPSFSTRSTCASKTPCFVGVVRTNTFLPAVRSARVAGAKVTTGALSGTVTTLLPPL